MKCADSEKEYLFRNFNIILNDHTLKQYNLATIEQK